MSSQVKFKGGTAELVLSKEDEHHTIFEVKFNDVQGGGTEQQTGPRTWVCHCNSGQVMSVTCAIGLGPHFNCESGACDCR
jgi:hypothetical protein